jgi:anthranilate synthase component II
MMKILVLDNYDSFTYNLVHYLEKITLQKVDVFRNDEISLAEVAVYDKIVLSPGPGVPDEAGILKELIREYAPTKSILGVCLGHQAIGEVFGATLLNMNRVFHGVATPVYLTSVEDSLFRGLPQQFDAGRYHSWLVDSKGLPADLEVTAIDDEGRIMAMKHKQYDVKGVQFHPESVLTEQGIQIMRNWIFI